MALVTVLYMTSKASNSCVCVSHLSTALAIFEMVTAQEQESTLHAEESLPFLFHLSYNEVFQILLEYNLCLGCY